MKDNEIKKICSKCVMDTSDPNISFDENGVCDLCNYYEKHTLKDWKPNNNSFDELMNLAEKIKKKTKNQKYNCIIGFSGGVDSSYLLYLTKIKMGLNPLVYICDTGWNTCTADKNIQTMINALGLDYYVERIDEEEMRDVQLSFFKAQVPYQDTPQDEAIFAGLYNYAVKNKIKYVFTGANNATESIRPPMEWVYINDMRMFKDIHKKYGQKELKTFPICSMLKYRIYYKYFKGMKRLAPLNLISYNKHDIEKELNEKFGWISYKQKHFEDVFTRWYEGYYLIHKFGYDKRKCYLSNLIHIGEITREQALKELEKQPYSSSEIEEDTAYIAKKLGITVDEFKKIINGKNKTFRDYKNSYFLIKIGIYISQKLGIVKWKYR